jgi:hypothetical protein
MFNRIATVTVASLLFALSVAPAFAGQLIPRLPEPTTMTLFGLGIGGAFIAKKLFGRK